MTATVLEPPAQRCDRCGAALGRRTVIGAQGLWCGWACATAAGDTR